MRIAIITETFLSKLDGVRRTVARVLEDLQANVDQAPQAWSGVWDGADAGAEVIVLLGSRRHRSRTQGKPVPPPVLASPEGVLSRGDSPGSIRCFSVRQAWDGPYVACARGHIRTHHLRCTVSICVGFPIDRMWAYNRYIHSQCAPTFFPSPSTVAMLRAHGFAHLHICGAERYCAVPTARRDGALSSTCSTAQTHPEARPSCRMLAACPGRRFSTY